MNGINFMESVNFEFLRPHFEVLTNLAGMAEAVLHLDPGSALTRMRGFAEELTRTIYSLEKLPREPKQKFNDLLTNPVFQACVSNALAYQLDYLRVKGNETAHGGKGTIIDANSALKTGHKLAMYMACKYSKLAAEDIPSFKEIPNTAETLKKLKKSVTTYEKELQKQQEELERVVLQLEQERAKNLKGIDAPAKPDQQKRYAQSQKTADSLQWNEAETRRLLIDTLLLQAGWPVEDPEQVGQEVKLDFPDNPSGIGYADYVLWGDDGQPLAVVEAKRSSSTNLQAGREQARLYADAFERMGKRRPVIFYTNGYETFIWDDQQYNTYRPVYGFYSKSSLEYLVYQRQYRSKTLEQHNPELSIAGRPYQIEAIKSLAETFQNQRRKGLIIQATGTGKTRVAIALAELLLRTGWAKRILFLCDRKELRKQSDEAFKEFLPSEPRCVVGESGQIDPNARVYIATYPGMMNRFSQLDVGFFDLIIADESHRSIYNKYRDLFDYYDALQVGLTATPVKFVSRNTFGMFGCETEKPTFEFDLDAAINNEPPYLVPHRVTDLTTDFLRDGIHYKDLSQEQQRQLEEDLGFDEAQNTHIAGKDIGRKIFSKDTDRIILENLMNKGIKDETGSLVGKTIIFAQRQDHAEHLEKLFCEMYPQHGNKVCKVIHNKVPKVESLIAEFKKSKNDFRIAISVDMLDTGIDVPEVVNLVFAKPVKSWVKFWQMIGRGTRLCPDLFGKGKDKTEFYIFDHYGNFDFFEEEYKEPEDVGSKSLLHGLFDARLQLAQVAFKESHRDGFDTAIALLKEDINDLPQDSIAVRRELRLVHQIQQTDWLDQFDGRTQFALEQTLAPLMTNRALVDKHASAFDRLIANLQKAWIENSSSFDDLKTLLLEAINNLAITIQAVRQKDTVIDELRTQDFWHAVDIPALERIRKELRGIMKYRKSQGGFEYSTATTRTADAGIEESERKTTFTGNDEAKHYRRELKKLLDEIVAANPVLQKIRNELPVTQTELEQLSATILTQNPNVSLDVLNEFYGRDATGLQQTLRELIGLDPVAVEKRFTEFLHNHPSLTAKQVRFMNLLKSYLSDHAVIELTKLYEAPFTSVSSEGVDGVFQPEDVNALVAVLSPFLPSYSNS
jgi:type I restriction enzyme R subunit